MSELNQFLHARLQEGEESESGDFKLDREGAVRKTAAHQISQPGYWALKVIQALVAGGEGVEIRVKLGRKRTVFQAGTFAGWPTEEIEERFWLLESDPERSFQHLKTGLWNVGMHQGRCFTIGLPGKVELHWNGRAFERRESRVARESFSLTVDHLEPGLSVWAMKGWRAAHREIASVSQALSGRGICCPVPLYLGGRRLDALYLCPYHGACGTSAVPMAIGFVSAGEPRWTVSRGTFEGLNWRDKLKTRAQFRRSVEEAIEAAAPVEQTWLAYLYTAGLSETGGKNSELVIQAKNSRCNWVMDGVVVHRENFLKESTRVSVGVFLSAEGLETDLTTLNLRQSEARTGRYKAAISAMLEPLNEQQQFDLSYVLEQEKGKDRAEAMSLAFGALVLPPLGLFMVKDIRDQFRNAGEQGRQVIEEVLSGQGELAEKWSAYARSLGIEESGTLDTNTL